MTYSEHELEFTFAKNEVIGRNDDSNKEKATTFLMFDYIRDR